MSNLIKKPVVKLPQKCKNPDMFYVPYMKESIKFDIAMLYLGGSINVMSYLSLVPLNTTDVVIQLANHSIFNHACMLEDLLICVDKLIFPTTGYILDIKDYDGMSLTIIILGRSFMITM